MLDGNLSHARVNENHGVVNDFVANCHLIFSEEWKKIIILKISQPSNSNFQNNDRNIKNNNRYLKIHVSQKK